MSLLKPHPPSRVNPLVKGKLAPSTAFEALLAELNAVPQPSRSRSNSTTRAAPPKTARAPSSQRPPQPAGKPPVSARDPRTAALIAKIAADKADQANPSSDSPATPRALGDETSAGQSWHDVVRQHGGALTAFETREVQQYSAIHYWGQKCNRKIHGADLGGANNHGFDDAQGDYKVALDDHIAYRYQILAPLGRGSFGQVSKALDHKTKQTVALKIIKNKKKFHEQAMVEVKVLKHLNAKDSDGSSNIVRMIDHFSFRNHVVIAFELHGQSLYDLHKAHRFAPMTEAAIRNFARQMLQTLVLTHREHVVHCDLKPENVLLASGSKSRIKVIDFGSSCFDSERLYSYIQSRFYRAPEVLLGIPYTSQIDMWSLGCMLAEFSNGFPLFPGESENQQMLLIMETFGVPPRSMLERAPRKRNFFDATNSPKLMPNSRGKTPLPNTKSLNAFVQSSNTDFMDLLRGMLVYEPERRLTPSEALRHPFFRDSAVSQTATVPTGDPDIVLPRLQPSNSKRR